MFAAILEARVNDRGAGRRWSALGLALAALLAGLFGCAEPESGAAATDAPYARVVLVTLDTLRADHLGGYGYFLDTSPFLDSLAEEGVLFEDVRTVVPHTAPAHASLLTGRMPHEHGVLRNGESLAAHVPTLASEFAGAGFETAAIVATAFLGRVANGFDHVDAGRKDADAVTAAARAWLEQRTGDAPFLLWVHYFDAHESGLRPHGADRHAFDALRREDAATGDEPYERLARLHGLPADPAAFPSTAWGFTRDADGRRAPEWIEDADDYALAVGAYDAKVRRIDTALRDLHAALASSEEPTLWIVTADHGEGLGSHGVRGHGEHLFDEQLRVPLVLWASDGSLPARRVAAPCTLLDLHPTLLELVGAEVEPASDWAGRSLWPLARGSEAWAAERPIFGVRRPVDDVRHHGGQGWEDGDVTSVVVAGKKLILREAGPDLLFDLENDPRELNDLGPDANLDPALREVAERWAREAATAGKAPSVAPELIEELRDLGYAE